MVFAEHIPLHVYKIIKFNTVIRLREGRPRDLGSITVRSINLRLLCVHTSSEALPTWCSLREGKTAGGGDTGRTPPLIPMLGMYGSIP